MSSDLFALVVAITLGILVVVLGLRRNLSEATRNGLPLFGKDPERATATLGLYEAGMGGSSRLDQRVRPQSYLSKTAMPRWMRFSYVVFGLIFVAIGISWLVKGDSVDGGIQTAVGVGWLLIAVFKGRRSTSHPKYEPGAA